MAPPTFRKGDRVAFKESPEVVEGKVVALWKGNFYRVAWDSGLSYQGKITIVSGNVIRKKAAPGRADGLEITEVAGALLGRPVELRCVGTDGAPRSTRGHEGRKLENHPVIHSEWAETVSSTE